VNIIAIIGLIAAACTSASFIPQAIQTIRTRNTSGISLHMYTVFTFGTAMWLLYGIMTANIPVIAANAITLLFALIILSYKIRYK
jgi:MtN3 and saliva related transmembrane protein